MWKEPRLQLLGNFHVTGDTPLRFDSLGHVLREEHVLECHSCLRGDGTQQASSFARVGLLGESCA